MILFLSFPNLWALSASNILFSCILPVNHHSNKLAPNFSFGSHTILQRNAIAGCISGLHLLHKNIPFMTNVWNVSSLSRPNRFELSSTLNRFSVQSVAIMPPISFLEIPLA